VASLTPSEKSIYNSNGNYTIVFTPQHSVATTNKIIIEFPSTISILQNSACIVSDVDGVTIATATCNSDSATNKITIAKFVTTKLVAETQITLTIDSIENPGNFKSPGELTITMLSSEDGMIDSGTYTIPSGLYEGTYIKYFSVTPESSQAGKYPVSYKFEVVPLQRVA